ncbi:spore photoproduct lyase family protein [Cytophagaceae bacterium ABcell3]|nr:spore photoproduct lyase family protein [Cytophagaceae bacterium ABcell3]
MLKITEKEKILQVLDIKQIYHEPNIGLYPRGKELLEKYSDAERIMVSSHWKIPDLYGNEGMAERWLRNKKNILVLGVKKGLTARPNTRSSHFVAPSLANGCAMACSYCYVPRRKGYANPITVFVNIEQILKYITNHSRKQGLKTEPDQIDEQYWVYEIGENSDCSVDAAVSDNIKDIVNLFKELPTAKGTFATKFVNRDMLNYDPQLKTRIRFSLMPSNIAKIVDVRTSPTNDRIEALNDFVEAGYEVHLNFSPVMFYDGWLKDYNELMEAIDDLASAKTKAQLKCEIIFLTHNTKLHDINMEWHPKGEELLWKPDIQETKFSQTGGKNLRYKRGLKTELVQSFTDLLNDKLPYCQIRYAF